MIKLVLLYIICMSIYTYAEHILPHPFLENQLPFKTPNMVHMRHLFSGLDLTVLEKKQQRSIIIQHNINLKKKKLFYTVALRY